MMTAHDTRHITDGVAGILSLADFRPAFGLSSVTSTVESPPAPHMAALSSFWESCLAVEGTVPGRTGPFAYPPAYEAAFDRVPGGSAVAFRDLPIGLQRLIGGRATEVWYLCAETPTPTNPPTNVQALAGSRWVRRLVPVRNLAVHVLTEWGARHVWPCGARGDDFFGIPPVEYTGGYTRLMRDHRFDAPVIFLDGEIHTHAVAYALALLRFAPDATVRVLEGTTAAPNPAGMPIVWPVAPRWAWRADGTALWNASDAGDQEMMPDTMSRMDRLALTEHAPAIVAVGEAFGLQSARETSCDQAVTALRDAVLAAHLPYIDPEVAQRHPQHTRASWRPVPVAQDHRRVGFIALVGRAFGRLLDRVGTNGADRAVMDATAARRVSAARQRLAVSTLRPFLPEIAVGV